MPRYFGLDLHKRYVHGCEWLVEEQKERHFRFPNTAEGWATFVQQLDPECTLLQYTGLQDRHLRSCGTRRTSADGYPDPTNLWVLRGEKRQSKTEFKSGSDTCNLAKIEEVNCRGALTGISRYAVPRWTLLHHGRRLPRSASHLVVDGCRLCVIVTIAMIANGPEPNAVSRIAQPRYKARIHSPGRWGLSPVKRRRWVAPRCPIRTCSVQGSEL